VSHVRRSASVLALAAAACLIFGRVAAAAAIERIPLQSLPAGVVLTLTSPSQYAAERPGRWVGPEYWASGNREQRGWSVIDWGVSFRDRAVEPESAAAAATPRGWREQERAGIAVPHVVGGRMVGTIQSYFVLKHLDAMHEAALAIPLSATAIAIVKFSLIAPERTAVPPFGDYLVQGSIFASSWNRGQAFLALSGVRIDGRLPPSAVSIEPVRQRLAVRGSVVDVFKHAIVNARVVLERRIGQAWRAVGSVRTNAQGAYTVRTGVPGRYRVSVRGTGLRSASVPVRK
jgi:hypothetical protein